jgi:hypothetical protein
MQHPVRVQVFEGREDLKGVALHLELRKALSSLNQLV